MKVKKRFKKKFVPRKIHRNIRSRATTIALRSFRHRRSAYDYLRYIKTNKRPIGECLTAVMADGLFLRHLPIKFRRMKAVVMAAVCNDGFALRYVREQTPDVCKEAVRSRSFALQFVREQTQEICLAAVYQNGRALQFVREQTPEICLAAVKDDGYSLEYVQEQTPEICLAAVKNQGSAIYFSNYKSHEICVAALKENGLALEYIEDQTEDLQWLALNYSGAALAYIKNPSREMYKAAVAKTGRAIKYVPPEEQTLEMCLQSLRTGPENYCLIDSRFKTLENQKIFIDVDPYVCEYIKNDVTYDLFKYAVEKGWGSAGHYYKEFHTDELRPLMVKNNPWVVLSWSKDDITYDMWITIACADFDVIRYALGEELIEPEMFTQLQILFEI